MRPDYSPSTLWSRSQPVKGWSVIVVTAGDVIYSLVLNANMNLSVTVTSNLARYSESSRPAWVQRGADYQSVSTLLSSHWRWKTSTIDWNFHSGKSSASLLGVRGGIFPMDVADVSGPEATESSCQVIGTATEHRGFHLMKRACRRGASGSDCWDWFVNGCWLDSSGSWMRLLSQRCCLPLRSSGLFFSSACPRVFHKPKCPFL